MFWQKKNKPVVIKKETVVERKLKAFENEGFKTFNALRYDGSVVLLYSYPIPKSDDIDFLAVKIWITSDNQAKNVAGDSFTLGKDKSDYLLLEMERNIMNIDPEYSTLTPKAVADYIQKWNDA